jgi:hypothetical protein
MLLSTAYRIWAAWRFDMHMPFPVFGSSDSREAANFVNVKVRAWTTYFEPYLCATIHSSNTREPTDTRARSVITTAASSLARAVVRWKQLLN